MTYGFAKGHGTENDFVLLPDPDGAVHGELAAARVRALCDRRAGLGGDGVIRVIRTRALAALDADVERLRADLPESCEWFMDYRNADGSVSEMCGNGVRVFARYLLDHGLAEGPRLAIGTRDGVRWVDLHDGAGEGADFTVDMGRPVPRGETEVGIATPAGERRWPAAHWDLGNPHAVAFVDDLADAGPLDRPPLRDEAVYPDGVNVEFVARRGERHLAMRVHERGVGETRSCGTGACAAMVAAATRDGVGRGATYVVDVPGGRLRVTWTEADRVLLSGPAVLVAAGETDL